MTALPAIPTKGTRPGTDWKERASHLHKFLGGFLPPRSPQSYLSLPPAPGATRCSNAFKLHPCDPNRLTSNHATQFVTYHAEITATPLPPGASRWCTSTPPPCWPHPQAPPSASPPAPSAPRSPSWPGRCCCGRGDAAPRNVIGTPIGAPPSPSSLPSTAEAPLKLQANSQLNWTQADR